MKKRSYLFILATALMLSACAKTPPKPINAPIKTIDIYVSPYYSAKAGKPEYINVYAQIDKLLLANNLAGFNKAVDIVNTKPDFVTPMTLFTLAARAYDLGLRDEAVFWYYNGRNRLVTVLEVLDLPKESLSQYGAFASLVGKFVGGYAFCDITKQRKQFQRSIDWVKKNPYQSLFLDNMPSKVTDRKQALKQPEQKLGDMLKMQDEYFSNAENKAAWLKDRKDNLLDVQFCWKA